MFSWANRDDFVANNQISEKSVAHDQIFSCILHARPDCRSSMFCKERSWVGLPIVNVFCMIIGLLLIIIINILLLIVSFYVAHLINLLLFFGMAATTSSSSCLSETRVLASHAFS
jgi:hypothetical protein